MLKTLHKDSRALQVRNYGEKENTYLVYNDDGESCNYEKEEFTVTKLEVSKNNKGRLNGKSSCSQNTTFAYAEIEWLWLAKQRRLNGKYYKYEIF